MLTHDLVYLV